MIKLGEKAKIFLAVLAVVVVAAGAVAAVALSSSANDLQNGLNAGNDQGAPLARASSDPYGPYFMNDSDDGESDITYDGEEHWFQLMFDDYDAWDYLEDVSVKGYDFNGGEIADDDIRVEGSVLFAEYYFYVTKSGNYHVTLTWSDDSGLEPTTVSFTIYQILVEGRAWLSDNGDAVTGTDLKGELAYSTDLTVNDILDKLIFTPIKDSENNNDQSNKYALQYGLFTDTNYTTQVTDADLTVGGVYYAKATAVLPYSAGDKAYLDYRLPANKSEGLDSICCKVTLAGPKLADPTILDEFYKSYRDIDFYTNRTRISVSNDNGTISAVYLGFEYKISQWFYDMYGHDKWEDTYEKGEHWVVTVNGTQVNPNTYAMMNVGTYNIVITPEEGYQFKTPGLTRYEITFTIKPYVIIGADIKWIDNKHVYTGEPICLGEDDYKLADLWRQDETLSLVFEINPLSETPLVDGKSVNAGRYLYNVTGIVENEYSNNYTVDDISNRLDPFVIYKKELPDFKANGPLITGTYNGQLQSIDLYDDYYKELGLGLRTINGEDVSYVSYITSVGDIVRTYPVGWNLGNGVFTNEASFVPKIYNSKNTSDESFRFTYAGSYTVEFIMQTGLSFRANHCWYGEDNSPDLASNGHYVWTNFALIERAEVDPLFEPTNILTNYDGNYDIASLIAERFQGLGDGSDPVYTLAYGKEGQTGTSATPLHGTSGNYIEGNYYVLININEDVYPNVYFKAAQDNEYAVNGRQARIDYSVTSSTVSITCNVKDSYTFGDNFDSSFKVATVTTKPAEGVTYNQTTIKYYDKDNNPGHSDSSPITDASLLVNGSPRNAGKYFVVITVDYTLTTESGSENLVWTSRTYELTVNKRQVTLAWYVDGDTTSSFTYDGSEHAVTVENTNVIEGVTNVTIAVNNATVTNAGTHDFSVDDSCIQGVEAANYTLAGVSNTTFTVTIGKASATVTANSVADVTYGKGGLNSSNLTVTVNPDGIEGQENITLAVYNSSNQLVTDYINISMGAYTVVPVWGTAPATMPTLIGGKYVTEQGNYSIEMVVTTFDVTAQAIKVTFKSGMSSVYGDEINLWSAIDKVTSGEDILTVEQLKEIASVTATRNKTIVITATKDGVTVSGSSTVNPGQGEYTLGIKPNSDNYNITPTSTSVKYTITRRPITYTIQPVTNHPYGETYGDYTKVSVASGSIVDGDTVKISGAVMAFAVGETRPTKQVNGTLDKEVVGNYYLVASVRINDSSAIISLHFNDEENHYYYEATVGNYIVTSIAADFVIVPRIITLTFTNGTATYGDSVNLWKRQTTPSQSSQNYYSKYDYVTATNLRFDGANLSNEYTDNLKDIIDLSLYVNGASYILGTDKINADTYAYKATVKNSNYKIADGENAVDEFIGGQFVVNKKAITVNTTASVSSMVYGNAFDASVLDFTVVTANGLVNGDTKADIGVTVGIFKGSENVLSTISSQNVGGYVVDLVGTSTNYAITVQKKEIFTISKRSATVTANDLSTVYGEALSGTLGFTPEAQSGNRGFVDDSHWQSLGIEVSVNGNVSALAVKEGGYPIALTITNTNADANTNYDITLTDGTLQIVQREITITAQSITDHVYGTALGNKLDGAYSVEVTNGTGNAIVSEADKASLAIALKIYNGANLVDNDKVAELDVATYDLKVAYTANSNYNVSVENATFKVIKLSLKVTYKNDLTSIYGEKLTAEDLAKAYTVEGTLLEGDEVIVTAFHNDTVNYPNVSLLDNKAPVGRYVVKVQAPNSNYDVTYENYYTMAENPGDPYVGAFRINSRTVYIIANNVQHTYGDPLGENELSYKVKNENDERSEASPYDILEGDTINVTIEILRNGFTAVTASEVSGLNVGEYEINLSCDNQTNTNYTVTPFLGGIFKVVARNVTVTPDAVTNHVYGEAGAALTYKGSNFVDNAHLTAMGITAKVYNGNNLVTDVSKLHVGTYEIRLDYPTANKNNNYNVTLETADFKVIARNITITANDVSHTYGDALGNELVGAYSVTTSNGTGSAIVGGDNLEITLSVHNVADSAVATLAYKVGGYAIDVNYDTTNKDYDVNIGNGTFTVNKRIVTITFTDDGGSSVYGEAVNTNSADVYSYSNNLVNVSGIDDVIELSCAATSTSDVGEYAVTATVKNSNYDVAYANGKTAGKYTITARKITITSADVTHIYGDSLGNKLTANGAYSVVATNGTGNAIVSDADKASLAITLKVYNGANAVADDDVAKLAVKDSYDIKVSYTANNNYDVDSTATAKFTVTKRTINVSFNNGSSTYGDTLASNVLDTLYTVTNLASGDTLTVTAKQGVHELTETKAPAGLYIVTVSASDNYTISYNDNIENGSYVINKKVVSASLEHSSVEYAEDDVNGVVDYHNGEYGATRNATVLFSGLIDELTVGNGYAVSYNTANNAAPNKAGNYKVTVTLDTNGNYAFAGAEEGTVVQSAELSFSVTKKVFLASALAWHEKMKVLEEYDAIETIFENHVDNYVNALMEVVEVLKITAQNGTTVMNFGSSNVANTYYFNDDGQLCIAAQGRARYIARFKLNENATVNYVIDGTDESGIVETICFIVDSEVIVKITTQNWQYGDDPIEPVVTVNDKVPLYGLSDYTYAKLNVTQAQIAALILEKSHADFKGFDLSRFDGMYDALSTEVPDYDVGYYLICVTYDGLEASHGSDSDDVSVVTVTICDFIEVEKKQLSISLTLDDSTYSGARQFKDVDCKMNEGDVQKDISHLLNVGESMMGINVGKYTSTVTIKDTLRYVWSDSMNAVDGVVTVTWNIVIDGRDNSDNYYYEVGNIATVTYGNDVVRPSLALKSDIGSGYGSAFTWYFAPKGSFTSATDENIVWKQWTNTVKPVDAGNYFVKVVLSDVANNGKNFTDKLAYNEFTINKATLLLTPSGTMVYGNIPQQSNGAYTVSGLIAADEGNQAAIISGTPTYYLVDGNGEQLKDEVKNKLSVGEYNLIVRTNADRSVYGLAADNYKIVAADGKFEVTARTIRVEIGNASSQFGIAPDLDGVTITYVVNDGEAKIDEDIVIAGVKEFLTTDATATSDCKKYAITSSYNTEKNNNFIIVYDNGEYEITKRQVNVTLNDGNGTYDKAETFSPVTIATVLDSGSNVFANVTNNNTSYVITIGGSVYTITVVYNGTAFNGTNYSNDENHPVYAGNYAATVIGSGSDNFEIEGSVSADFAVGKFIVDASKISVLSKVFADKNHSVDIEIEDDADFTKEVFEIYGQNEFKEVGNHDVSLKLLDYSNYKWSDSADEYTTVVFFIDKAGIYATPTGNITYGTAFDISTIKWKYVYASNGNDVIESEVNEITVSDVKFIFDREINLDRPLAGTYKISCEVNASGRIIGLSHGNYNITLKPNDADKYGDYVVNKKAITIVAGNSTSIYSQNPADYLSTSYTLDTTVENNELVFGDVLTSIVKNYAPSTVATASSDVNKYAVTATAEADNYAIDVKNGQHEILPIKVKITLTATDGRYHVTEAKCDVSNLEATNLTDGYDFTKFDNDNLAYYFTGIEGTTYGGATRPENAGKYEVTVTSINNVNGNFVIDTVQKATFTIAKMIIDESSITIASKKYQGVKLSHGLTDGDGYTVSTEKFQNVGTHNVTLTLTNANNYEWSDHAQATEITKTFTITAAKLQLKPNGTITYGDSFEANFNKYGFELIGLVGEDVGASNDDIVSGTIKYLLANEADGIKLEVRPSGYAMTADVSELVAANYEIEVIDGVLTVNKRNITIKPVASQSVYGQKVVVSNDFTLEDGTSLANGDTNSVIDYLATCAANEESDAKPYVVTIVKADNNNYNITRLDGTHTIVKAKVGVTVRALNGIYGDENNKGGIEFVTVEIIHEDGTTESVTNLKFVVNYSGTVHDSSIYDDNNVPTKAGVYTAVVRDVISDNYELDRTHGISRAMFEISKRQIDARKIIAVSAEYTGKSIIPQIEDTLYNVNGQTVYNTVYNDGLKDVGTYDITLSLVDTYNCEWEGNLNRTTTIKFVIVKADNSLVDVNNPNAPADSIKVVISDWTFDGEASKPQAAVASGEQNIVFEYATSENGDYTTEVPKNAGEYWVRATVAASNNYNAYVSKATKFVISKKVVNLPVATNLNENNVYTGSMLSLNIEGFDDQIMSVTLGKGMYRAENDGKLSLLALNADTYTATFKLRNANNYVWADTASLEDGAVVVNWTVERQVVKRLPDATNKILVNGEDIVFMPDGFNSGIMIIEGNVRAHEGNYSAVVTLKDTKNYVWEGTESASITVVFELIGTNVAFIAAICVVAGLSVGLAVMAVILTLVNRNKKRKEAAAIDARSRADGWEGE